MSTVKLTGHLEQGSQQSALKALQHVMDSLGESHRLVPFLASVFRYIQQSEGAALQREVRQVVERNKKLAEQVEMLQLQRRLGEAPSS